MSDIEKNASANVDHESLSISSKHGSGTVAAPTLTPFQYRKLIWKLDLHLLPPLWALWFVSLIDRVNIGNAKLQGLEQDLHMDPKTNEFNIALVLIFVGLIVFEVPSNYLVKRFSPRVVLCAETFLLGEPFSRIPKPFKY
jgi:hypothetical protein